MFDLEVIVDFMNECQLQFDFGKHTDGVAALITKTNEVIISSDIHKYWNADTFKNDGWESYPFEVEKVRVNSISYPDARKIAVLNSMIKHSFSHTWERIMREVYTKLELDADTILPAEGEEEILAAIKAALDKKVNIAHAKRYPYRVIFLNSSTYVLGDISEIPNNCRETNEKDDYGRIIYREINKETDKWEKDYDHCVWNIG